MAHMNTAMNMEELSISVDQDSVLCIYARGGIVDHMELLCLALLFLLNFVHGKLYKEI